MARGRSREGVSSLFLGLGAGVCLKLVRGAVFCCFVLYLWHVLFAVFICGM